MNKILREFLFLWKGFFLARKSDLLYSNGHDFKSYILSRLTNKPCYHKIVGNVAWERAQNWNLFSGTLDEYQVASKNWKLKFFDFILHFPLKRAKKIIVPSEYLKLKVMQWGVAEEKILVIYNGFSKPREEIRLKSFDKRKINLVTVCRLVPWKGVDGLLRLLKRNQLYHLTIVGSGPMESHYKEMSRDLGVENQVHFAGQRSPQQVDEHLKQADIFVLNSSYEGLPHVVLEAFNFSTPVLASRCGGTPELVIDGETGFLFDYNEIDQIQETIENLQNSDWQTMLQNAHHCLESKFSQKQMLNSTCHSLLGQVSQREV
jgi:glycosyltransferase involved in cell wall biosynthesis